MNLPDILILLAVLLATGLGVHFVQGRWPYDKRQKHGDVAGFIFGGVSVMYSVLLAFVAIVGWETLSTARQTTYVEVNQLTNVYWIAHSLPAPTGPEVDSLALQYADTVANTEWPLMAKGESSSEAERLMGQIRNDVFAFTPRTAREQVLYQEAVSSMNDLTAARRDRLDEVHELLPEPLWLALIVGAVLAVGFCLTFGVENKIAHIGMLMMYAVTVTILLLLIRNMQYPFSGNPHIGPNSFEGFLSLIRQYPQ